MEKSLIVIGVAVLIAALIVIVAIFIQNASRGSDSGTGGPGLSFRKPDTKWLMRVLGVVAIIAIVIWFGPPLYHWVTGLKFPVPGNAGRPVSEETMEHIMAPRHDTGWSRAVPIPLRTAHFQCPAEGPEKACSDYNTDMAKAPFLMQCQKTPGGVFENWSMEACKGVHAFRLKSKSDQPVRVGYWFEPISQ